MEDYYDESGELGMSKKSSKHFIMSGISIQNPVEFEKFFKKFVKKIHKKKSISVLHARDDSDNVKIKLVKFLKRNNWSAKVYIVVKNKSKFKTYLQILEKINLDTSANTNLVNISTFDNKKSFIDETEARYPKFKFNTPINCTLLQIADFIAWASFKKFEHGEDLYFKSIEDKIEIIFL